MIIFIPKEISIYEKIINEIELYLGNKIDIDKTIMFFDEVQVSESFIVSLKYFNESEKPYKIVCAGSLLGVKINRFYFRYKGNVYCRYAKICKK